MSAPARVATLVALPVAALAGVVGWFALHAVTESDARPHGLPTAAAPSPTTAVPSAPVALPARALTPAAAAACQELLRQLPADVRGVPRRRISGGVAQHAAYGEPPITITCGVPAPTVPQTTQLLRLDGVCWFPQVTTAETRWTTVDRSVPVTITVPGDAAGAAQRVIDFSAPVVGAIGRAATVPYGCR